MLHTKIIDTKDSKLSIQKAENFISSQDYGASIFFTGTVRVMKIIIKLLQA